MNLALRIWKWLDRWRGMQLLLLRFFTPRFFIGVVAVIFDNDGRVVLFHHTYKSVHPWALPGGWMKRGEEPAETIRREIREEAGLEVEILAPLAAITGPVYPNAEIIYLAKLLGGTFRPSREVDEIRFFALEDLPDLQPYQREVILAATRA